ncbi:MAG: TIR domain-containing protein, partial [Bradyrhizobium sp.]
MPKIFVSYRRRQSEAITGRILDRLRPHFGATSIFVDIDNILPGVDFRDRLIQVLNEADVMIVIVGPKWLGSTKQGSPSIHDPNDWVRIEVETALRRKVLVIPVLVDGTEMPHAGELPPELKDFAYRHAETVSGGRDFHAHVDHLIHAIDESVATKSGIAIRLKRIPVFLRRRVTRHALAGAALFSIALLSYRPILEIVRSSTYDGNPSLPSPSTLSSPRTSPPTIPPQANPDPVGPGQATESSRRSACLTSGPRTQTGTSVGGPFIPITIKPNLSDARTVRSVAVSPTGAQIATGSDDGIIRIWDTTSSKILHILKGHTAPIYALDYWPDGTRLMSASLDGTIRVWSSTETVPFRTFDTRALPNSGGVPVRQFSGALYPKSPLKYLASGG